MSKPIAFVNSLSAGLHVIPANCPLCDTKQWDGIKSFDADAPYGDGSGIEDVCLNIDPDPDKRLEGLWSVCHVTCKHWFRDMAVNRLGELARQLADDTDRYNEQIQDGEEFDKLHEAIRNSISSEHGDDVLIAMLGPGYIIPNPTAEVVMGG